MTAEIIDGKAVALKIRSEIKEKVSKMKQKPGLAVVIVGDDPASQTYVNMKEKACNEIGYYSEKIEMSAKTTEKELLKKVSELNNNPKIHGFIVQLPLPKNIDEDKIIDAISPKKDADGFHPVSVGNLLLGKKGIVSATPKGIMRLLDEYKVELEGKHAVVVGRSNIVGKPVSLLLQQRNCTVTMCNSRSKPLDFYTKQADILVVAAGKPNLVTGDMVKEGCVIIDVGTNKVDGKLVGDCEFESCKAKASKITPVPGGVGPMTIAMLLENTIDCMNN
ncbi:MAG: bifunctional methylenetetrahydrofolate dehydrogenase/methenyltetrahydrofolate cyclohydrolase FolD [Nanoarchaeota archaeon]|nr:bifunctional methylenetetrahydrofolate dehydrogenase/methenyltetrahydrofolate cyclohydrolase FolD [Nanoarchaeota archaeon]MBU1704514.1 bifunctional methylenetetrahydrofolate dehydrogenase/methenyltetrahydrofolate cyclohydrolase FolD [Nanoarchaeota archaeon]